MTLYFCKSLHIARSSLECLSNRDKKSFQGSWSVPGLDFFRRQLIELSKAGFEEFDGGLFQFFYSVGLGDLSQSDARIQGISGWVRRSEDFGVYLLAC